MSKELDRGAGILLPVSSLPSPYGIGTLGKKAYEFVDMLKSSGQMYWQVLPVGPTSFGDSPYQSFSAFAGNPYFIDLDTLIEEGLLEKADVENVFWGCNPEYVEYDVIYNARFNVLKKAFEASAHKESDAYKTFLEDNKDWLHDYAVFMACKDAHEGKSWQEWDDEMTTPTAKVRLAFETEYKEQIKYYKFIQFLFFREWMKLKKYANEADIEIIGDITFFVSFDSADVWANKELYQLDTKGHPLQVAGVPPDYFSATGQLWGNPLYDWKHHEADGYSWWIDRIKMQMKLTDYLRIDHFRGFEAYWSVPADEETAVNGKWKKGPGKKLFEAIQKELGEDLPIWAEDLGVITPEVEELRDEFAFPGMKILQFAFEGLDESDYHPHNLTTTNCICYTGTHDNDTTTGWYQNLPEPQKDKIRRYCNCDGGIISLDFIRMCMGSIAKYAIFPIQDLFMQDSSCRMNTPGSAFANWAYRYEASALTQDRVNWLKSTTELFGRGRSKSL